VLLGAAKLGNKGFEKGGSARKRTNCNPKIVGTGPYEGLLFLENVSRIGLGGWEKKQHAGTAHGQKELFWTYVAP